MRIELENPIEVVDRDKTELEMKQLKEKIMDEVKRMRRPVITAGMKTQKKLDADKERKYGDIVRKKKEE